MNSKIALVTGGNRGLGQNTVLHLARRGVDSIMTAHIVVPALDDSGDPATLSREMMEANPLNISWCPYGIFAFQTPDNPGEVTVGFHDYPEGEMKQVEDLLDSIVREALGLD